MDLSPPVNCPTAVDHNNPFSTFPCGPFLFHNITELTSDAVLFNSTAVATASASISGTVVEHRDSSGRTFNQIGNIITPVSYTHLRAHETLR